MNTLLVLLLSLQDTLPPEAQRLERLERQIEERAASAAEIRERTEEMEGTLTRLRGQLVSTAAALQAAEKRATGLEQDLQDIEAREAAALEDRDARSMELSEVLAALQNLERSRPPALVVSPGDAQAAALAAISLSALTPRLGDIVAARRTEILRLAALREDKRKARAALDETETALAERSSLLEGFLKEREQIYRRDRAALRSVEQEASRLAAEASNLRELLARLRDLPSSGDLLDSYRRSRRDRNLPSLFADAKGLLDSPVTGVISRRFGDDDGAGGRLDALELATRPGAVVTTPYKGQVRWAAPFGALGNVLILDVGGGYTTILIGLDRFIVEKDQRLSSGEPVGIMDQSAAAPRLRYQVRQNGRPVDPAAWLADGGG